MNILRSFLVVMCMISCKPIIKAEELVPGSHVDGFKKSYSSEEMALIGRDLAAVRKISFSGVKSSENTPVYLATAGGPGACKSTILSKYLSGKHEKFVFVDPDEQSLKNMPNTYGKSNKRLADYEKWRDASNYIANTLLNEAFAQGCNIAHGATSTAKAIDELYKKLKRKNYKIILILCYAPDKMRQEAVEYRENIQHFGHVVPADVVSKGKMFAERFPVYFEYADEILCYWTEDFLNKGSTHVATYVKNGDAVVHDQAGLDKFIKKYTQDCNGVSSWDDLVGSLKINGK